METNIYFLHRGDNIPFYIGKSVNTPIRKNQHNLDKGECHLSIIDVVPAEDYVFWEKYYIELFKGWGFNLENKNNGGGGVISHSEETKQKMSKPKPLGFGETISNRLKGHKQSKSTIEKRVKKNKGKKRTLEQRKRISDGMKGVQFSQERNQKIGDAKRGIPQPKSKETIKKLKKPILQFDKEGNFIREWEGAVDAGKVYGNKNTINNALHQRRCKTAYGYIWKFKN